MPPIWLITFTTRHARISEKMVVYHVPRAEPLLFTPDELIIMARLLMEGCQRLHLPVVAASIVPDHVHLVTVGPEPDRLSATIGTLKGSTAHRFHEAIGSETGYSVWAKGFHRRVVAHAEALAGAVRYVQGNPIKHAATWGQASADHFVQHIQPLLEAVCITQAEALALSGMLDG